MPHQCTNCGRTFDDGSKEMLSGCPSCGGNKFQFVPGGDTTAEASADVDGPVPTGTGGSPSADVGGPSVTDSARSGDSGESGSPRPWPTADTQSAQSDSFDGFSEWPDSARRPANRTPGEDDRSARQRAASADCPDDDEEDTAQADARSAVVAPDELPDPPERELEPPEAGDEPPANGRVVSEPSGDRPSLEQLREELNQQFESIKIVRPGEYELNLMELYNREEYIVSLQEDGRYVIDVPDSWRDSE